MTHPRHYRLERRLHTGAVSSVWLANQTALDRAVVVKFFHGPSDPQARDTLLREVSGLCKLRNPNNVQIVDVGEGLGEEPGTTGPFVVLEYVPGTTLRAELLRRRRLSATRVWRIALQVLAGLSEAHVNGIVHRDLKPDNLMLWQPVGLVEHVKVIDYGLARRIISSHTGSPERSTGGAVGTPHYMAPEVIRGAPATPAADIYALGVLMYEALAGQRPFEADDPMALMYQHVHATATPLRELAALPDGLANVVHRALDKDPAARFATAAAFQRALHDLSWEALTRYALGDFAPLDDEEGIATDVFEPGAWEAAVGLFQEPEETLPAHTYRSTRLASATDTALRGAERPTVWVLTEDPATDAPVVAEALAALEGSCDLFRLDAAGRAQTLETLVQGWQAPPWVLLFGDLHVLLQEPLLARLRGQASVSRLLLSTHLNAELLQLAVNFAGLDQHVSLPLRAPELAAAVGRMVDRTRAVHHEHDQLRIAVRDARTDAERYRTAARGGKA